MLAKSIGQRDFRSFRGSSIQRGGLHTTEDHISTFGKEAVAGSELFCEVEHPPRLRLTSFSSFSMVALNRPRKCDFAGSVPKNITQF